MLLARPIRDMLDFCYPGANGVPNGIVLPLISRILVHLTRNLALFYQKKLINWIRPVTV
jgi:hypothetical protein